MFDNHFKFFSTNTSDTMVFVHGWAMTGQIFESISCPQNRVIAEMQDPFQFTESLLTFLDAQQISKVSLCGYSMGGFASLLFAKVYPERVNSLTLCGVRHAYVSKDLQAISRYLNKGRERFLTNFYRQCLVSDEARVRFEQTFLPRFLEGQSLALLQHGLDYLGQVSIVAEDLECPFPVTLLHGEQDMIAPIVEVEVLSEKAGVSLQRVGQSGHAFFLEREDYLFPFSM